MSSYTLLLNGGLDQPDDYVGLAAEVFGATEFEARRVMSTRLPRLYGRFEALHQAEGVAGRLRDAGVHCLAGAVKDFLETPDTRMVRSLDFSADPPLFRTRGNPEQPAPGEAFLLVIGRLHSRERTTREVQRPSLAGHAVLGYPVKVSYTETSDDESFERVLILFHGDWWNALTIREKRFHYPCLGEAMGPTRHGNFQALRRRIEDIYAPLEVDDRLMRVSVPSRTQVQHLGVNSEKTLTDNTDAFWQTAGQMARLALGR